MLVRMWLKVWVMRPRLGREKSTHRSADGLRRWDGVEELKVLLRLAGWFGASKEMGLLKGQFWDRQWVSEFQMSEMN